MSPNPEVQRVLDLLSRKIREKSDYITVGQRLGWGRSRLSFLLAGQASLRLEHFLGILDVIEMTPYDFFQELYAPA
jgi:hypothetical protein